ncbi:enolase-phosphatase E1 [Hypoxylon sp. FL1150]|nr:enolase-phosphatase E1 [Hypoxylon sp. FL1150]
MTSAKVVLLDIEGTVCPISFVKDVLFPYALEVLPDVLEKEWSSPEFVKYKEAFPPEHRSSRDAFEAHVRDLVAKDVKASYLKSLQGYLWEEGYVKGDLKAPLFPDVAAKMAEWRQKGLTIMIYSSGSVAAQKLLFKHTNAAPTSDLTPQIADWFDTVNAGLKTDESSYKTIASKHPEFAPGEWLFLSDNVKEVDAAIEAGMRSVVAQRPGNAPLAPDVPKRLRVIETFESLDDI